MLQVIILFAYYLGVTVAHFYRFVFGAFHFASIYFVLSHPTTSFTNVFWIVLLLFYAVYGLASLVSMILPREDSPLLAVVISLFAAVFNGYVSDIPDPIKKSSYAYWATEALFNEQTYIFRNFMEVENISAAIWGYHLNQTPTDFSYILLIGTIYRFFSLTLQW